MVCHVRHASHASHRSHASTCLADKSIGIRSSENSGRLVHEVIRLSFPHFRISSLSRYLASSFQGVQKRNLEIFQSSKPVVAHIADVDNHLNMFKSPCLLLPSYGIIFGPHASYSNSVLASYTNATCRQSKETNTDNWSFGRRAMQCRGYAHVQSQKSQTDRFDDLGWPQLPMHTPVPTPYQIFQQAENAPYSKSRFYELVKLYHPDCCSQHGLPKSLSPTITIERYRLVIAANEILSDPERRRAYDRFGSGWDERPHNGTSKHARGYDDNTDWTGFDRDNSPAGNATWEDWEKWYRRDGRDKQEPVYFSNGGFFGVVLILVGLGGIGHATSVGGSINTYVKRIEMINHQCTTTVQNRRKASHKFGNQDERMERFLRTRDPYGYSPGLTNEEN